MEARTQRLEQAVFGVDTGNGLYREVKAMRNDLSTRLDSLDAKLDEEREEREAEWTEFYRRAALWFVGAAGTVGIAFIINRLP